MKALVLDCSITIAWCLKDHPDDYAERVLDALVEMEAVEPPIWPLEVVNVLLGAERRKCVDRVHSRRFLEDLQGLRIHIEPAEESSPMSALLHLAGKHGLTAYDASYLDTAMRNGLPMATGDDALKKACKSAGVPIFKP